MLELAAWRNRNISVFHYIKCPARMDHIENAEHVVGNFV